jgi:hypothetical protein
MGGREYVSDCRWIERWRKEYLARLAGAEQEHLDLILCHNLVSPELILNFFIACGWAERSEINGVRWLKGERTGFGFLIDDG